MKNAIIADGFISTLFLSQQGMHHLLHLNIEDSVLIHLYQPLIVIAQCNICYGDVDVCHKSCCVSVTLMYCAQTTESIIMQPLPDCSPAILVFPYYV